MNKVEVELTCEHSVRLSLPVDINQQHYCRFDGWSHVQTIFYMEWRIVCAHCTYGRWTGQSEREARKRALHHERTHTGHAVIIIRDTVTKQGGTPRPKIIAETFHKISRNFEKHDKVDKQVKPLPAPF